MHGHGETREQQVASCSKAMKNLAKELQVPVLLLSQLSREVEKRKPPRPRLSDLRDSGSIEQDADKIILLFRPALYSEKAKSEHPRDVEARLEKNRNGPIGTETLDFDPPSATFRPREAHPALRSTRADA
jgi:replicative DNA helicase